MRAIYGPPFIRGGRGARRESARITERSCQRRAEAFLARGASVEEEKMEEKGEEEEKKKRRRRRGRGEADSAHLRKLTALDERAIN